MDGNAWKLQEMDGKELKWLGMEGNEWKQLRKAEIGQK